MASSTTESQSSGSATGTTTRTPRNRTAAKALAGVDGFGDWIEPITDAMFVTEHIIIDTPVPAEHHKWVAFVKKLEHVTRDELSAAWLDGHAPNVSASIAASNGAWLQVRDLKC